jgi:thiol-disulfide isomerase/thioredoxin
MRAGLVACAIAVAACSQTPAPPPSAPHPLLGREQSFTLPDSAGRFVAVPAPGVRSTVVDFWAPWCKPCARDLPRLIKRATALHEDDIEVVIVAVLAQDEPTENAMRTLRSWGVLRDSLVDRGGALQRNLLVRSLPATLVLDARGTVRWVSPESASVDDAVSAARATAVSD